MTASDSCGAGCACSVLSPLDSLCRRGVAIAVKLIQEAIANCSGALRRSRPSQASLQHQARRTQLCNYAATRLGPVPVVPRETHFTGTQVEEGVVGHPPHEKALHLYAKEARMEFTLSLPCLLQGASCYKDSNLELINS